MTEVRKGIFRVKDESDSLVVRLSKEFFEKEAIMSAIHEYTDEYDTSMYPLDDGYVGVSFKAKEKVNSSDRVYAFTNRVVDHQIRRDLDRESGHIRDMIVDYAYSPIKKKLKLTGKAPDPYGLMPFQFSRTKDGEALLVNMAGEHTYLDNRIFEEFINKKIGKDSEVYKRLRSKFFLYESYKELEAQASLISNQIRTKQRYLQDFTSLHMVEITNYCNLNCDYCHASSVTLDEKELRKAEDLRKRIIDATIDMIFESPSPNIKIELQGGEPLVNWKNTKYLIERAYEKSLAYIEKTTEIILCTNLLLIDEEKLEVLKKYNVTVSTSLDGTRELHDKHRKTHSGKGSYDTFIKNLELTRSILGHDKVGALLTVSRSNLYRLKEVIDEYVRLGFHGVFIRALNPYGMATKNIEMLDYPIEDFVEEYIKALNYIIELNLKGVHFVDYYSSLLLSRVLTPFSTGFMDLQSPAGAGISGVMYDFNGDVYPTDEARMLARTGNTMFRLGNVLTDSYDDIFNGDINCPHLSRQLFHS